MRRFVQAACAASLIGAAASTVHAATTVSPAGDSVPANLLRIELHFDAPRREPLDMRQVRLRRAGKVIDEAFLGLSLPSRDGRAVTILLHPGRIKTGVGANLALGPVLNEGDRVTLEVDDLLLRKTWQVTAALRRPIAVADWRIELPTAGSRADLRVTPDATLGAGAAALIGVADGAGHRVAGRAQMTADGVQWRFVPFAPWRAGRFMLRVHPALEDVAGNRPCAAFEQHDASAADCRSEGLRPFAVKRR